jgi:hypothetical protein
MDGTPFNGRYNSQKDTEKMQSDLQSSSNKFKSVKIGLHRFLR